MNDKKPLTKQEKLELHRKLAGSAKHFSSEGIKELIDSQKNWDEVIDLFNDFNLMPDESKKIVVLGLFVQGKLSLAKAAEMYGETLNDFIEFLRKRGIPAIQHTEEEYRILEDPLEVTLNENEEALYQLDLHHFKEVLNSTTSKSYLFSKFYTYMSFEAFVNEKGTSQAIKKSTEKQVANFYRMLRDAEVPQETIDRAKEEARKELEKKKGDSNGNQ